MKVASAVECYVQHMRASGFEYITQSGRLYAFSKHVGDLDMHSLKTSHVLAFLNKRPNCNTTWRAKHALLRNFLEHWQLREELGPIAMPILRPRVPLGFVPYIYSRGEIKSLLREASRLRLNHNRTMDPRTLRTVFLFLYGTGARLKEAVQLQEADVDLNIAEISIRGSRMCRHRTIPIGPDLLRVLRSYINWKRRRKLPEASFFSRLDGAELKPDTVYFNFEKLLVLANLVRRDGAPQRPRIYDLRSTFAVHRITSWIRQGSDLGRLLPALSAYMGQKDLSGTERFLGLTPERFRKELDKLSPSQGRGWIRDTDLMKYIETL
jgi:integrase/recombinase XerD